MDDFKPSVNTMEEIKKLQELVRKLEMQNLQLRNKQNLQRKRSGSPVKEVKPSTKSARPVRKNSPIETIVDNGTASEMSFSKDEYFDDLEIIKVSDSELSDDESWLYTSPKSGNQENNESPFNRLQNGTGEVKNEQLQFSKNALLTKLNELEILSTPNRIVPQPGNPTTTNLGGSQLTNKRPIASPLHGETFGFQMHPPTFTRHKKLETMEFLQKLEKRLNDRNALEERMRRIEEFYVRNKGIDVSSESWSSSLVLEDPNDVEEFARKRDKLREMEGYYLRRRGSDVSSDSLSSCHVLEDANDVQEVARMQEESLRMNSPLGTPKRNSGNGLYFRKVSTSSKGSTSDQDTSESSVFGLQVENVSSTNDSMESSHHLEACHYSDESSPSESPYGSNASLHNVGKEKVKLGGYRRSLPNLNKDPSSARQTKIHSENTSFSTATYSKGRTVGKRLNIIGMFVPKMVVKRGAKSPSISKQSNLSLPQPVFLSPEKDISEVTKSSESNDSRQRVGSGLPKPSRASSATRSIPRF